MRRPAKATCPPRNAYLGTALSDLVSAVIISGIVWGLDAAIGWLASLADHPEYVPQIPFDLLTFSPYTIPIAAVAGFAFFWLRCRHPLYYGFSEIAASLVTIFFSTSPAITSQTTRLFALLAGIYVFVRGMDNLDKRLKATRVWQGIFWGSRS